MKEQGILDMTATATDVLVVVIVAVVIPRYNVCYWVSSRTNEPTRNFICVNNNTSQK